MPPFSPISRRSLIGNLRKLGVDAPFTGGRHQFMLEKDTPFSYSTLTKEISAEISSRVFCVKQTCRHPIGTLFEVEP